MNAETFQFDFKTAIKTMLNRYFDGNAHTFGGSSVSFPDCDVIFERPQIGSLSKTTIVVDFFEGNVRDSKYSKNGFTKIADHPIRFLVFTSDRDRRWGDNDNATDLLAVLLHGAAEEFALLGLKVTAVKEATKIPLDSSQELQVSQRIVTFRTTIVFGTISGTTLTPASNAGNLADGVYPHNFTSNVLDFLAVGNQVFTIPTGKLFFINWIDVICDVQDPFYSVTLQPTIEVGLISDPGKYLTDRRTNNLVAIRRRQPYQSFLSGDPVADYLRVAVKIPGAVSGGNYKGRFFVSGTLS